MFVTATSRWCCYLGPLGFQPNKVTVRTSGVVTLVATSYLAPTAPPKFQHLELGIASQHQRKRLRRKLREAPPRLAALFGRPERIAPCWVLWLPFKATERRSFKPQEGHTSKHMSHPCFGKMKLAIVMCHSPTPVSLQSSKAAWYRNWSQCLVRS